VVIIFVGDWLREDVGKRWVATPAQGDRLILSTYNIYPNMGSIALAAPCCVRLWVEKPFLTRPGAHNPSGLDKIP